MFQQFKTTLSRGLETQRYTVLENSGWEVLIQLGDIEVSVYLHNSSSFTKFDQSIKQQISYKVKYKVGYLTFFQNMFALSVSSSIKVSKTRSYLTF